jgi:hypothetical protein
MMLLNPTIIIVSTIAAVAAVMAAWISPTVAVIAAVIAAGAAITAAWISRSIKISEFRQKWIDDLRNFDAGSRGAHFPSLANMEQAYFDARSAGRAALSLNWSFRRHSMARSRRVTNMSRASSVSMSRQNYPMVRHGTTTAKPSPIS